MTLPVSSYEELLIQVRELTHETILLQRQLSSDLFDNVDPPDVNHNFSFAQKNYEKGKLLTDNVIRHCDKTRETEIEQKPVAECNNLRLRPRYCHDLESSESTRSGELTSRLLTWRSHDRHPIVLQVSDSHHHLIDANLCTAPVRQVVAMFNIACLTWLKILIACAIDLFFYLRFSPVRDVAC